VGWQKNHFFAPGTTPLFFCQQAKFPGFKQKTAPDDTVFVFEVISGRFAYSSGIVFTVELRHKPRYVFLYCLYSSRAFSRYSHGVPNFNSV
jgi:hypothetical protein